MKGVKPETWVVFGSPTFRTTSWKHVYTPLGGNGWVFYMVLLVLYAHTRSNLRQLHPLISSRIIYDYINIEGVEGDAEVTQKGEVISSDYFSLLLKTINVTNM